MAYVRSLDRGLEILALLARGSPLKARTLALQLGMPRSSIYRFLNTLLARRFIEVDATSGRFTLGSGVRELVASDRDWRPLCRAGFPIMSELSAFLGETALLTVRSAARSICVERVAAKDRMRSPLAQGEALSTRPNASSMVLLAYLPEKALQEICGETLSSRPPRTSAQHWTLRELTQIRKSGYAVKAGDASSMTTIGAPVRDSGEVVACLSVAGPATRLSGKKLARAVSLVKNHADQISRAIDRGEHPPTSTQAPGEVTVLEQRRGPAARRSGLGE